jgi:hypothetical protein
MPRLTQEEMFMALQERTEISETEFLAWCMQLEKEAFKKGYEQGTMHDNYANASTRGCVVRSNY